MTARRRSSQSAPVLTLGTGSAGGQKWPLEGVRSDSGARTVYEDAWCRTVSERQFQQVVRKALEDRGFTCWVVPNMKLTVAGLPDILAWHPRLPGLLLALELKRERDARITPAQRAALAHLETVPGIDARILRPSGWRRLLEVLDLLLRQAIPGTVREP